MQAAVWCCTRLTGSGPQSDGVEFTRKPLYFNAEYYRYNLSLRRNGSPLCNVTGALYETLFTDTKLIKTRQRYHFHP